MTAPVGRAGVVTRILAAVVDTAVVAAATVVLHLVVIIARFAWSPLTFRWPAPPAPLTGAVFVGVAVVYLTAAWAGTGRSQGGSLLGLRVVSARLTPLGWLRAGVRAVLCVVFPVGLLWCAISANRRSVQDVVVRSVVVYDGHRDGGARLGAAAAPPATREKS